jgi:hypothetical protein
LIYAKIVMKLGDLTVPAVSVCICVCSVLGWGGGVWHIWQRWGGGGDSSVRSGGVGVGVADQQAGSQL